MKYLLDVNVLIAACHTGHKQNQRALRWLAGVRGDELLTTPITELGFVRIAAAAGMQPGITAARSALMRWKRAAKARLVGDDIGTDRLPAWVNAPAQTTDGHLLEVATTHGAKLATMDTGIPGAALIP